MSRKDWRTVTVDDINYEPNELKNELIPMLRTQVASQLGDPKPWASKLVSECAERLQPVISFTAAEREFLDRLLDHAEIKPTLIHERRSLGRAHRRTPASRLASRKQKKKKKAGLDAA